MPVEDRIRSLSFGIPSRGIFESPNPASAEFPRDGSPDLENIRVLGAEIKTRLGIARYTSSHAQSLPVAAEIFLLSNHYGSVPTVAATGLYRLAVAGASGNNTLYQRQFLPAPAAPGWTAASGGTGLGTLTGTLCTSVMQKDFTYLSDRAAAGTLQRFHPVPASGNQLRQVTQGTAPTVAPTTKRRLYATLEPWSGSAGAVPDGWAESDATHFKGRVADTALDATPDFPCGGAVLKMTITDSGAKKDTISLLGTASIPVGSHWLALWCYPDNKQHRSNLDLGVAGPQEFSFAIDPVTADQTFMIPFGLGNLPAIKYLRFRCAVQPSEQRILYFSKIVLSGNLDGKYRYRFSYYAPSGGTGLPSAETRPAPASEFVDCSQVPVAYKTLDTAVLEKCVELTTGAATLPSTSTYTKIRWYRNGGVPSLTVDQMGQPIWLRLAESGNLNSTLSASVSAGAVTLTCPTSQGAANLSAGDWLVLDRGVAGKEELVQVAGVDTGVSPNKIYAYQGLAITLTDLVIDGSVNTRVSSASRSFQAADIGKTLHITAGTGFTAGYPTISSLTGSAANLSAAAGTVASTGGTGTLLQGVLNAHSSGATLTPALLDNTANESADSSTRLEIERDDPPAGIQWLSKAPDGRLWAACLPLLVRVSNLPTADRPWDYEVFPDNVSPLTRRSLTQGFPFFVDGDASGDRIVWAGFFNTVYTVLTSKNLYQVHAYGQLDWSATAVKVKIRGVGCIAGESVCEVNGQLYWLADGPRVMRWSGAGPPQEISYQRITTTLSGMPSTYWSSAFARPHADENGIYYRLWLTPSGATTPTKRLDYNVTSDAWEPAVNYDGSGNARGWKTALVWDGPGDAKELYVAEAGATGQIYQHEKAGQATDAGTAIKIRATTPKVPMLPGHVCNVERAFLRLFGVTDTITLRVRVGGVEYRNATDFPATDGDPSSSKSIVLTSTSTAELQVRQRFSYSRLKGRWCELRISGDVSNRPGFREAQVDYSVIRRDAVNA